MPTFFEKIESARLFLLADRVHCPALQLAEIGVAARRVLEHA